MLGIIEILQHPRDSLEYGDLKVFECCRSNHLVSKGLVDMHRESRIYFLETPQYDRFLKGGGHCLILVKFSVVEILRLVTTFFKVVVDGGSELAVKCLEIGVSLVVEFADFQEVGPFLFKVVVLFQVADNPCGACAEGLNVVVFCVVAHSTD